MKKNLLSYLWVVTLCLSHTFSYSQKTNTVNYTGSGLSTTACNVFNTSTLAVIGGLTHYPLAGGVVFKTTYIDLGCQNGTTMATTLGTGYAIQYPFKPGYSYTINMTRSKASVDPVSLPFLTLSLFTSLPDPNSTNPGACGSVGQGNWNSAIGIVAGTNYISDTALKTVQVASFVAPAGSAYQYLSLVVSQGSSSYYTDVKISSLTITESVALSVSPTAVNISCGTAQTQTFTVSNPNNAAGIAYTWNPGAVPNGWQYNGADAPASIATTTNTLTLTAPACGITPKSVSVVANLTGYNIPVGTISTALAPYSITGTPSPVCTSGTYSIANLNCPSASVVWSVSPAIATLSCTSCTQTTLTKAGNGSVTLSASITGGCIAGTTTLNQTLYVGAPQISVTGTQGGCSGSYQSWYLSAAPSQNGHNYNWFVNYVGPNSSIYLANPDGSSTYADVRGGGQVTLNYADACNVAQSAGLTVYSTCQTSFSAVTVAPNPAVNTVTITAKASSSLSKTNSADLKANSAALQTGVAGFISQIKVFDISGRLKKTFHYATKISSAEINVSDLVPGIYLLEISNGTEVTHEKIIVQR